MPSRQQSEKMIESKNKVRYNQGITVTREDGELMLDMNFLVKNGVDVEKSLELFGTIETYNDTVGEFILGVNNKIPKLEEYKNAKDMNNYAIYVHSLKSDAKYFGFTKLAELAYDQEMKSKAGDVYYIYEHYNELMNEVQRMTHVVKQYLGQEPVAPTTTSTPNTLENLSTAEVYTEATILVVDDSNIVRNFVSRIFKDEYKVGIAKDGQEAIDLIEANKTSNQIKAILLDLNMPNVDGFAVLEYMKGNRLFTTIPVSIISGDSTKETIDKAFTYQIVDMVKKPFNDTDIKRVVEKTIYFKEMN